MVQQAEGYGDGGGRTLAFLGPSGTYTEEAALRYDPGAELRAFPSIPAVGRAVAAGETGEGVVPIENSIEGWVNFTLDLLVSENSLLIRYEIVLPIEHYLMGKPGTRLEEVRIVYSHPQALAQCREYLERNLAAAERSASLSTAQAVGDAMGSAAPAAAIAPLRAAALYRAEVLASGIQDVAANATRFVALARSDHEPTGNDKTSLFFTFDQDLPGQLYGVMGEFARREINSGEDRIAADEAVAGAVRVFYRLRRASGGAAGAGGDRGDWGAGEFAAGAGVLSQVDAAGDGGGLGAAAGVFRLAG